MLIGLVGDLEGERNAAVRWLEVLGERGDVRVAYQLGDLRFGMGPDPEAYLAAIDSVCTRYDLRLFCTNGNHENWAELDRLWSTSRWIDEDGGLKPIEVAEHVTLLPRGHRWNLGGRSFVALGGAPSINRHLLTEGVDWWPSEVLLDEHVDATIAGGHADVMLTHDSPLAPYCTPEVHEVLRRNASDNPMEWPESSLAYADEGLAKITRAVLGVQPMFLAHGHFHVAGEGLVQLPGAPSATTVWSLAARHEAGTVRVLDLDSLTEASAA
ncbi:metallophosphoesterase [Nocardioides sp.]|uniref:metallophosphoesterase n=1 Tax=Nocardioides sp. TaxID=35761 RepID=UPI001A26873C|nr:metallophosphoesterase [Nocardioides sp.]MBJ7358202.1 metallophosphoesterase [Nocardioides sp.]